MNTTVHCLGYNTHLFLKTAPSIDPKQVYFDSVRLNNITDQVKKLSPDIVGFSEVWANSSKDRLIKELKELLPYCAWDNNKNPLQIGSGLLLLSRFPLSKVRFTQYNDLVGFDKLSQKGFILATLEIEEQKFLIAHTHTQADCYSDAINARKLNVSQLQSAISKIVDTSTHIILLGDLNITGETNSGVPTNEYQFLCDLLKPLQMIDVYRTLNPSFESNPGYTYDAVNNKLIARFAPDDTKNAVRQRIDYMFVRGLSLTGSNIPSTFTFQTSEGTEDLSDHYPLESVVQHSRDPGGTSIERSHFFC